MNKDIKTIVYVIVAICSFVFSIATAYSSIVANTAAIAEMRPKVDQIPVIETKIEFIVNGMEKLTNTKYNE